MKIRRSPLRLLFIIVLIIDLIAFSFNKKIKVGSSKDIHEITEQTNIEDKYYWAYIAENSNLDSKFSKGTWYVSLKGEYLREDSIHLQQLLTELNGLMGSVEFKYTSDTGQYNWNLSIINKAELSWTKENYYIQSSGYSTTEKNGERRYIDYILTDKLSQEERNSIIKSYVVHTIIDFYDNHNIIYPKKNGYLEKTIDPMRYSLPQNDQKFIKMLYANHFYLELFKSSAFNLFTYLNRNSKEYFSFTVKVIVYFLIIAFFFLAFRFKLIDITTTESKGFHTNTLSIAIGVGMLNFLLMLAYWSNYANWSFLIIYMLNFILFTLFVIHIIKYIESKLIKKEYSDPKRIILQGLISFAFLLIIAITPGFPINFLGDTALYFVVIITGRTIINFQKILIKNAVGEKEFQLTKLQQLQHQTELEAIHSRINPHFLYNALNSLASLTRIAPEKAEEMALSLSDYFRYSINRKNEKMTTLKDELESVKNYLKIEKIRFSNQLEYSIRCEEKLFGHEIPRLLLQPLVENAIKHGTSKMTEKGIIKLMIYQKDTQLIIKVSDNGRDFPEEPIPGFGLQSIYDKMAILYKGEANINWTNKPDKAIIISLPIKPE